MMKLFLVVAFFFVHSYGLRKNQLSYMLGTKSPYWNFIPKTNYSIPPPGCRAIQLNYVFRHGTRNPSEKDIRKIKQLGDKIRQNSKPDVLATWLKPWNFSFALHEANLLVHKGVLDMEGLGKRFRKTYGTFLPSKYSVDRYVFQHTHKTRTFQSAAAFASGFFGSSQPIAYDFKGKGQDYTLRFFDVCEKYLPLADSNVTSDILRKYSQSEFMKNITTSLSKQMGLEKEYVLSKSEGLVAHSACAFDVAVHNITNQWCSFFDKEALHAYEYLKDLKVFWKKGYGHDLNWEMSSPLLLDIYQSIHDFIHGRTKVVGHFRFGHAETIVPLICLLGLWKSDSELFDSSSFSSWQFDFSTSWNRVFRSSEFSPFAANVGFVLYECSEYADFCGENTHRIKLLINEKETKIPECSDLYCPLDEFAQLYKKYLFHWKFAESCHV